MWASFLDRFKTVLWLSVALSLSLTLPSPAEKLKISPEDLQLRVAVSKRLSPPVRLRLRDLAANTPLPVKDGLIQTDRLLDAEFEGLSPRRRDLVRYYFLLARLEKSQEFSREFFRRNKACLDGIKLLDEYIHDLNRLIARAVFSERVKLTIPPPGDFPLGDVGWKKVDTGQRVLKVLRPFPEPQSEMGRGPLRRLRVAADRDRARLEARIPKIILAEKEFLAEASLIGHKLRELRGPVRKLVGGNRAGLPFSF